MVRNATAVWTGTIKEGSGRLTTDSGALSAAPYSFRSRFEDEPATNPEELIAAAHAGCFSMKLSGELGGRGVENFTIETKCSITMVPPKITQSYLDVKVTAPGGDTDLIRAAAEAAKAECPISMLLNCEISMSLATSI